MSDQATKVLAANAERARLDRRWTQKDLAVAVGTTRDVIANLESGRMQSVSLQLAADIAAALDTPLAVLIGDGSSAESTAQRKIDAIRLILGSS
ncbi:multiprotein-bridging factor 1 family protein [Nocardia thailandica]|uniref:Multiprotein-bridging factor 1 family protein n=1 Tax=Nocardia thailandica TaxID=257275 RepID=A0ABW6PWX2_9NOCA